jgi:hypothetical protein
MNPALSLSLSQPCSDWNQTSSCCVWGWGGGAGRVVIQSWELPDSQQCPWFVPTRCLGPLTFQVYLRFVPLPRQV